MKNASIALLCSSLFAACATARSPASTSQAAPALRYVVEAGVPSHRARLVKATIRRGWSALARIMPSTPGPLVARIYRTRARFLADLRRHGFPKKSARFFAVSGAPRPLGGQFYIPPDLDAPAICHELTHAFADALWGEAYKRAKWLDEGFATHVATKHCGGTSPAPRRQPALAEMTTEAQWHRLAGPRRRAAYQRAAFVVGLLAHRFGDARLVAAMADLRSKSLEAALAARFKIDSTTIEQMAHAAHDNVHGGSGAARFALDTAGVDAWIACRREGGAADACLERSRRTLGGRIAHVARPTFGEEENLDARGLTTEAVAAVVRAIRSWDLTRQSAEIQAYLPRPVGGTIRIFVVANGHRWGDGYVRRVAFDGDLPRLAPRGEPVVVLNARNIVMTYGDTAAERARSALGVVKHEVFHVLFRRYQTTTARWRELSNSEDRLSSFVVQVLNEGVAHFVHRHSLAKGLPRERAVAALTRLAQAITTLRAGAPPGPGPDPLHDALQGSYWGKFGAIGGLALAHGVFCAFGHEGIRRAIRCGPAALVTLYRRARQKHPDLPQLPEPIARSFAVHDLCLGGE